MPSRIIREGILTSERVDRLSESAEVFYRRLHSVVDDFGRFSANPKLLRSACYPLRVDQVPTETVVALLGEAVVAGLVVTYEVAGKPYLQVLDFNQQLRNKASKYPARDGSVGDRSSDGYLYFLTNGVSENVRIGFSANPWARAKELASSKNSPFSVVKAMRANPSLEKELTAELAFLKIEDGWHKLPRDLLDAIVEFEVPDSGTVDGPSFIDMVRSSSSLLRATGGGGGGGGGDEGVVGGGGEVGNLPAAAPTGREKGSTIETWVAYSDAYKKRWGVSPVRNRKVSGMLAQFVERIGREEAPGVARFYVEGNRGLYVSAKHPVNLLLRDAEGLRTEWATGRRMTDASARSADRTATRGEVFGGLLERDDE